MTQHNLTQILKVIRDLVMRNRPCYRDYLGSETVTKTVQIGAGTFEDNGGVVREIFPAIDPEFSGFILGETYTVAIDGVAEDYMARVISPFSDEVGPIIGTITTVDAESGTFDGWLAVAGISNGSAICIAQTLDTSFVGKTISISQTKTETVKRYNTKLLPEYLLPTFLRKNVVATKTEVQNAVVKAIAAKDAASNAQTKANDAQTEASSALFKANTAQTTANTAKSTAEAAQSAANTALERTVEPYTRNAQMAPLYKNGGFSAWRDVVQQVLYNSTEGYFFVNGFDTTALKEEDMPKGVFRTYVRIENRTATAFLSCSITGNSWLVSGFAVITDEYSRTGEILHVSSNTISKYEAKGLFLTFRAPNSMLLKSSTAGSTKQFRITVDDTGTLKATEVT